MATGVQIPRAMQRNRAKSGVMYALGSCLLAAPPAWGVDEIQLQFARLEGAAWRLEQVELQLRPLPSGAMQLNLKARDLYLPAPLGRLQQVQLQCPAAHYGAARFDCADGQLRLRSARFGRQTVAVRAQYNETEQHLRLQVRGLRLAHGRVHLRADWRPRNWQLNYNAERLELARAARLWPLPQLPTIQGRVNAQGQIRGRGATVLGFKLDGELQRGAFANADRSRAGEELQFKARIDARRAGGDTHWQVDTQAEVQGGIVCFGLACWELAKPGPQVHATLRWQPAAGLLQVSSLQFRHGDIAQAQADFALRLQPALQLQTLHLRLQRAALAGLYRRYLQPLTAGSALGDLDLSGQLAAKIEYAAQGPLGLHLRLHEVSLRDPAQRFAINGLDGRLLWTSGTQTKNSSLRWRGGNLYRLNFGAAQAELRSTAKALQLRRPLHLPVLDGELRLAQLELENLGSKDLRWTLDAVLLPVSMRALTAALGWHPMEGRLSGVIPKVRYANQVVQVGGVLLVRAFDGNITLRNLKLTHLLSTTPALYADVSVDQLDLQAVTQTFQFGSITGKLSGEIKQLQLYKWAPVAFDAKLATPAGDRSERRISQRAVANLSEIGSGVSGALSRSFLGVFETFAYDRLGLQCRLSNGVCEMDGVAPAANGYYIVKGRGIPRIDVIGFARRVAWDVLVERIRSRLDGPGKDVGP